MGVLETTEKFAAIEVSAKILTCDIFEGGTHPKHLLSNISINC